MTRTIDSSTLAALLAPTIYPCWILRLDIQNDPVYLNTGLQNLTFAGGSGYDSALVGFTFLGLGNVGIIDAVTDSTDGSQTLNLTLPGISLTLDYLHQFITNADLWQRKQAYLWMATLGSNGALIGKPIRIKTARIDQITFVVDPDNMTGTLTVSLESQQSYDGEALYSRYQEQPQIDSSDISQSLAAAIANAVPGVGYTGNQSGNVYNQIVQNNLSNIYGLPF